MNFSKMYFVLFFCILSLTILTCNRVPVYPEIGGKPVPPDWEWGNPENYGRNGEMLFEMVRSDIVIASYNVSSLSKEVEELNKRFGVEIIQQEYYMHHYRFLRLKPGTNLWDILTLYGKGEDPAIYGNHPLVKYAHPCFGFFNDTDINDLTPERTFENLIRFYVDSTSVINDSINTIISVPLKVQNNQKKRPECLQNLLY